ncbi:DUF2147 domain-containing protein [Chitinophaga filiformis]|uniref:DUF2147 domain-containing protein n=1 Tax=Chitinophaga filiformis TaxID=104663 RepID=UPI001F3BF602|nr:DUF2147 domain-containing protein [Chitinophaga filiformis]MCF6405675.1 DUF2147 domain-containing protein [Chitinophaga filiformis]
MKLLSLLTVSVFFSLVANAQTGKVIVGKWFNEEKDGKVEIYERGNKYYGKLIWMKDQFEPDGKTLRKDSKNKDTKLRSRTLLNTVILNDFVYEDGKWIGGEVYDPKSGKTYSSEMKLKGEKLEIRGYVGNPMFGQTSVFTRE